MLVFGPIKRHCKNAGKKRNILHPVNPWDLEGEEVKPDSVAGESWDYADGADITIEGKFVEKLLKIRFNIL